MSTVAETFIGLLKEGKVLDAIEAVKADLNEKSKTVVENSVSEVAVSEFGFKIHEKEDMDKEDEEDDDDMDDEEKEEKDEEDME
jgi:hypothetical protein